MAEKQNKEKAGIRVKDPQKYEYAYLLYMQKVPQKEIAERVGVSQQTLSKWKEDGGWELKRVAKTVSRDQIINKVLLRINEMLDSEEEFNADEFSKAANQLSKLKQGCTIDDIADILTRFGDWVIEQSASDKTITTEFVQQLTQLQDKYLLNRINNGYKQIEQRDMEAVGRAQEADPVGRLPPGRHFRSQGGTYRAGTQGLCFLRGDLLPAPLH